MSTKGQNRTSDPIGRVIQACDALLALCDVDRHLAALGLTVEARNALTHPVMACVALELEKEMA